MGEGDSSPCLSGTKRPGTEIAADTTKRHRPSSFGDTTAEQGLPVDRQNLQRLVRHTLVPRLLRGTFPTGDEVWEAVRATLPESWTDEDWVELFDSAIDPERMECADPSLFMEALENHKPEDVPVRAFRAAFDGLAHGINSFSELAALYGSAIRVGLFDSASAAEDVSRRLCAMTQRGLVLEEEFEAETGLTKDEDADLIVDAMLDCLRDEDIAINEELQETVASCVTEDA